MLLTAVGFILNLNCFTQSCMETENKLSSFEEALNSMYKNLKAVEIVFRGPCQLESHS